MSALLIGLDLGTTATKCVLVDAEHGVVGEDARPVALSSRHPGWAEEDPAVWWRNACELIPAVLLAAGLTGGGSRSALWRQIIADVLGLPVRRSNHPGGAALGAAFAAGMATGVFGSWDAIGELATVADRTEPDPGTAQRYGELYGVYRSLYPALIGQQHTLARFA